MVYSTCLRVCVLSCDVEAVYWSPLFSEFSCSSTFWSLEAVYCLVLPFLYLCCVTLFPLDVEAVYVSVGETSC
jgi:hypothetical protein